MQFAIRHPDRTAGLFLLVPAAYYPYEPQPDAVVVRTKSGLITHRWASFFDTALKSDLLFWATIQAFPDTMTGAILGTPPEVVHQAERSEQQRIRTMMTHILPVSRRRLGLLNDARVTSELPRYELEQIQAPTLVISLKDDRYGTFEGAQYTAGQIADARFIGYESGGHLAVGHQQEILQEATRLFSGFEGSGDRP
jgi:pimeloyl-ACP methyl ester carboxylesterase